MAEALSESRVVLGRIIPVKNINRKPNAKYVYNSIWVEDDNGENERCLLFTERELKIAEERATKNKEDIPSRSWLTNLID